MTGDCHVRFRERFGMKFPLPTRSFSRIKTAYDEREKQLFFTFYTGQKLKKPSFG